MSSSAINAQLFQAKIGSIQNQADSTSVYSNGVWSFKNSTALPSVTIDNSGNVGIGTASPVVALEIVRNSAGTGGSDYPNIRINNQNATGYSGLYFYQGATLKAGLEVKNDVGDLVFGNGAGFTERIRIDSNGNLLVANGNLRLGFNAHIWNAQERLTIRGTSSAEAVTVFQLGSTTGIGQSIFLNGSGGLAGYIQWSGTSTSYITTSDYRLKEDVQPISAALSKVATLKPCTYKWKVDGSEGEGFIAHELAETCPAAVTGEKDAVNEDGSIKPQGIDPSKLVALLTAAIQEQQAMIEELKAKVSALESK